MISARLNSLLLFVARSMTPRMLRLASALEVRAESHQTAIAILHHELALVLGHVAKSPSEFHALGGVLGIKCVGIFNEQAGSFAQGLQVQTLKPGAIRPRICRDWLWAAGRS